jgi:hypothetical protein
MKAKLFIIIAAAILGAADVAWAGEHSMIDSSAISCGAGGELVAKGDQPTDQTQSASGSASSGR